MIWGYPYFRKLPNEIIQTSPITSPTDQRGVIHTSCGSTGGRRQVLQLFRSKTVTRCKWNSGNITRYNGMYLYIYYTHVYYIYIYNTTNKPNSIMWLGKSLGCTFGVFFVRIPAYLVSTATLRPFKKPLKFAKGREIVWESRGCVWECDRTWWNPIFWWFSSCVIILHLKLAEMRSI